jgi:hypothetical protein
MRSGNMVRTHHVANRASGLFAFILGLAVAGAAGGVTLTPAVTMSLQSSEVGSAVAQGPMDVPLNWLASSGSMTIFQSPGNAAASYGAADVKYSVLVNTDPVITHNLVLTNNTAVPQAYVMLMHLPLDAGPVAAPTAVGGSVDVDVQDETGDGARLGVIDAATPIYQASTDSGYVKALLLGAPDLVTGVYETQNTSATFGAPIPSLAGPVALTHGVSLQLAFTLTPGDTATVVSNFVLEGQIIPEPASLVLGAVGVWVLVGWRRRA